MWNANGEGWQQNGGDATDTVDDESNTTDNNISIVKQMIVWFEVDVMARRCAFRHTRGMWVMALFFVIEDTIYRFLRVKY